MKTFKTIAVTFYSGRLMEKGETVKTSESLNERYPNVFALIDEESYPESNLQTSPETQETNEPIQPTDNAEPEEEKTQEKDDLSGMKKTDLIEYAKLIGVDVDETKTKAQIVELIENAADNG